MENSSSSSGKSGLRRHAGLVLRIVVSVAILAVIGWRVEWGKLARIASTMDPLWLAAAFATFGPMLAMCSWRWQILLRVQDITISWWHAFQLVLVGQFFNCFLLGATGGDVAKIYYATRTAPHKKAAAGLSVIVDRLYGLVVLLVIALFLCIAQFKFLTARADTSVAVYFTLAVAAGMVVFGLVSIKLVAIRSAMQARGWWEKLPAHGVLDHLVDAYNRYGNAWRENGAACAISVVNHSCGLLLAYCIARSLHLDVPFWPFLSILPILNLIIAVPISVSGFGVREGMSVILFGLLGWSKEHAITFSLAFFSVNLFWGLVGSVFYMRYQTPIEKMERVAEEVVLEDEKNIE